MKESMEESTEQKIINAYKESGENAQEASRKLGISVGRVRNALIKNKIQLREWRLSAEEESKIIERYLKGESSEVICKDFDCDSATVLNLLKRKNIKARSLSASHLKNQINCFIFNSLNSEKVVYLIGFLTFKSSISKTKKNIKISIHKDNKDILQKIIKVLYLSGEPNISQDRQLNCFYITNTSFYDHMVEKINENKPWPKDVQADLIHHFIRGVFDAIGSFCTSDNRFRIIFETDIVFLRSFHKFLSDVNINSSMIGDKKPQLVINSKETCLQFFDFIYKQSTIYIDSKFNTYQEFSK
jgi:intein/homing endonuclease